MVVDPEGDYSTLEGAVVPGDPQQAPTVEAVLDLLAMPRQNVVVNLVGIPIEHRPAFSDGLLPRAPGAAGPDRPAPLDRRRRDSSPDAHHLASRPR